MIDREELRRLALAAETDQGPANVPLAYTSAGYALARALDPRTVLALLDEAKTERACFEAACDACDEFDQRLERLAQRWDEDMAQLLGQDPRDARAKAVASHVTACARELRDTVKERR